MSGFVFRSDSLDVADLKTALEDGSCGACVTFEGWVRNHNEGMRVNRLEYEAYEPIGIAEGDRVLKEACEQFAIEHAQAVHRTGMLEIGDCAVWVGVSSAHRDAAFEACRYIIDEIKVRLPIWKKEHYENGDSGWVNCEHCARHALQTVSER